ncbi:aspartate carbamoyltransferase [Besnoitia besnoiti]|uniref:Aspartate carbamoyltransferase n=1 Tax=Besnoitia besnoiti TaxID=94643 RepID=A0A2A9M6Q1_BESBE|nr:aspartate carbamoyltransferase [Besnoitia besnoiti]PFH31981.1 aspartate carbamoyltransferase [Besnoitia besnoiti]
MMAILPQFVDRVSHSSPLRSVVVCSQLPVAFRLSLIRQAEEKFYRSRLSSVSSLSSSDVVLFVTVASELRRLLLSREAEGASCSGHQCDAPQKNDLAWWELLKGKVVATVFFEPSTRTRCSFEAATLRLGGRLISCGDMQTTSSTKKGESLEDSVRMFAAYSDAIVLRHPEKGSMERAGEALDGVRQGRPPRALLSAGDGAGEHPTQALLDMLTLAQIRPRWWRAQLKIIESGSGSSGGSETAPGVRDARPTDSSLGVAFVGDLKHGRTVHSLAMLLSRFDCHLMAISTEASALPPAVEARVRKNFEAQGLSGEDRLICSSDFIGAIQAADVLYMTRLQSERLPEVNAGKPGQFPPSDYQLNRALLEKHARPHLRVMHPLPRREEVAVDVDGTPHCAYFTQAENGLYMRMALLAIFLNQKTARMLLGEESRWR